MIIWSGPGGLLSAAIVLGCLGGSRLIVNAVMEDDRYFQTHHWPKAVAFLTAAVATWLLGMMMNRTRREPVPDAPGLSVVHRSGGHSLFYIPIQWLWVPLGGFGLIILLK